MNELQFNVEQSIGEIDVNFEEIEQKLAEKMSEYKGVRFTEDSKQIARAECAELRKYKKSINDRKIEVKNQFMQPYMDFESKVKRLITLVDEPIELINMQIKTFDENRIKAKKSEIESVYAQAIGEIAEYLPLRKIYDPKWENVATTIKSIGDDITRSVEKVKSETVTINMMQSDAKEKALEMYKESLDLSADIQYINGYEQQKAEIIRKQEERHTIEEQTKLEVERERIRAEERKRVAQEVQIKEQAKVEVKEEIASVDEKKAKYLSTPESIKIIYTVVATPDEQREIEMALTSLGVYFERKDV